MDEPSDPELLDRTATEPSEEEGSHELIGVKGPGRLTWNMTKIQRGFRFTDSLFQAVGDDAISRLKGSSLNLGASLGLGSQKTKQGALEKIVREMIDFSRVIRKRRGLTPGLFT